MFLVTAIFSSIEAAPFILWAAVIARKQQTQRKSVPSPYPDHQLSFWDATERKIDSSPSSSELASEFALMIPGVNHFPSFEDYAYSQNMNKRYKDSF